MSKIKISPFFAFAFAIFIFPANGLPLPNGELLNIGNGNINKMPYIPPFADWVKEKSPELFNHLKLLVKEASSPDALRKISDKIDRLPYIFSQVIDAFPEEVINKELPKLTKYIIQGIKEVIPVPKQSQNHIFEELQNQFEKLSGQIKSSALLDLPEEPPKPENSKIEMLSLIPIKLVGVDENTPSEQIYDGDIKKLENENTDTNKMKEIIPFPKQSLSPIINALINLRRALTTEIEEPPKTSNFNIETLELMPVMKKTEDLVGVDENTPYEQINDWAMKKLGNENIDRNSYVPDVDFDDLAQVPDAHNDIEQDDAEDPIKSEGSFSPLKSIDEKDELFKMVD